MGNQSERAKYNKTNKLLITKLIIKYMIIKYLSFIPPMVMMIVKELSRGLGFA